jgi:C-terminal processing protease CtpA/Prc
VSKHLITAAALFGLTLVGPPLQAQQTQENRAQQHMRAYLGAAVETGRQANPNQQEEGVAIEAVQPNSPAARAGLRNGDVITRVGSRVVEDFNDLANAITRHHPGDRVNIRVLRNGEERTLRVTLGERSANRMPRAEEGSGERQTQYGRFEDSSGQNRDLQRLQRRVQQLEEQARDRERSGQSGRSSRDAQGLERRIQQLEEQVRNREQQQEQAGRNGRTAFLGVQAEEWTPEQGDRRSRLADHGVLVSEVDSNSPAAQAGLRRGDVITSVNGKNVSTPQELSQCIRRAGAGQDVSLEVLRGDRQREFTAHLQGGSGQTGQYRQLQALEHRLERLENQLRDRDQNRDQSRDRDQNRDQSRNRDQNRDQDR